MPYLIDANSRVIAALKEAPPEVREQYKTLVRALAEQPYPGQAILGVLPLKENHPHAEFTAPFDNALLVYRVLPLVDYRVMRIIKIIWL